MQGELFYDSNGYLSCAVNLSNSWTLVLSTFASFGVLFLPEILAFLGANEVFVITSSQGLDRKQKVKQNHAQQLREAN